MLAAPKGAVLALSSVSPSLAAAAACLLAEKGRRVMLVTDNDLKAARAADDARQLRPEGCAFLPAGELDLTRAAGSRICGRSYQP